MLLNLAELAASCGCRTETQARQQLTWWRSSNGSPSWLASSLNVQNHCRWPGVRVARVLRVPCFRVPSARGRFACLIERQLPADEYGQGYSQHYDSFDTTHGGEGSTVTVRLQGNRIVSALGYLSSHRNAEEGGRTEFPRLGLQISPQVGRLLVFSNMDLNAQRYEDSLHSSLPFFGAERQRKWVFNLWFRASTDEP
jgi:hypothetical protein